MEDAFKHISHLGNKCEKTHWGVTYIHFTNGANDMTPEKDCISAVFHLREGKWQYHNLTNTGYVQLTLPSMSLVMSSDPKVHQPQ